MAATVFLSESNGAGEVVTDNISNLNMGSVDLVNLNPNTYPIVIPNSAGTETPKSSFVKFFRVKLDALGGSSNITNLLFWKSSGNYKTGESISANCDHSGGAGRFCRATYHTPFQWKGVGNSPAYTPLNIATTIPPAPNVGIDITGVADDGSVDTVSGSLTVAGTYSQYIVMYEQITNLTPAGALNQKTFTVQYDES